MRRHAAFGHAQGRALLLPALHVLGGEMAFEGAAIGLGFAHAEEAGLQHILGVGVGQAALLRS